MQLLIRYLVLIILIAGCKSYNAKYPYSLSDFSPELRPHLEKVIQRGGMCYIRPYDYYEGPDWDDYSDPFEKVSTKDLYRLLECEHPELRIVGFEYLQRRKVSDIGQLLLKHLDDTAIITVCNGEFGPGYTTVADQLIESSRRDSVILKSVLKDAVITKHSYLNFAYAFIHEIEKPEEKYYPIIKEMVKCNRLIQGYEDMYYKMETSLYALSKYKKKEDVPFIANAISIYWGLFSEYRNYSFKIIEENPDTAYFKTIHNYYRSISGRSKINVQFGFSISYYKTGEKYDSFLAALIAYKNKESAELIDTILKQELYPDNPDFSAGYSHSSNYPYTIYTLLKKNECADYKKLIKLLEPRAIATAKEMEKLKMAATQLPADNSYVNLYDERYW